MTIVVGTRPIKNNFKQRLLKYRFTGGLNQAGNQVFINGNSDNSETLTDFRSEVSIRILGGQTMNQASITIYNAPLALANSISSVGLYDRESLLSLVQVEIYASTESSTDDKPTFIKIFGGGIVVSYADYNAQPNPTLRIEAQTLGGSNIQLSASVSFAGDIPVETIVQAIVNSYSKGGLSQTGIEKVVNYGVKNTLSNPHYYGSFWQQLQTCANDADFEFTLHNNILYIYPKGEGLQMSPVTFSPMLGMMGYPQYSSRGMIVKGLFKPSLIFGQPIQIRSTFKPVNGIWDYMVSMQHDLSCHVPGGQWSTTVEVAKQNLKGSLSNVE